MWLKRFATAFCLYLGFAFFSCREQGATGVGPSQVFHYNQPNAITSLDPAFAKAQNNLWAVDHLYNQLLDLDDSLNLLPEVATQWSISEDATIYRFQLRKDILFHKSPCFGPDSTRYLVASDVVYSFGRLLDPAIHSPGSWIFKDIVAEVEPFRAPAPELFELRLRKHYSPLLKLLTMQYCSIIPREAVAHYQEDFAYNPVGTNGFKLKKWQGRKGLFLERHDAYFGPPPVADGIRISFIEDRGTAYLEFLNGSIDFFSGIHAGFAHQLLHRDGTLKTEYSKKMQLFKGDFLNTEYIGFNLERVPKDHPLQVRAFRQALNYAIDREKLIRYLRFGLGTPANSGFIPKGLPGFDPNKNPGYDYNPTKARQLLDQAGYSDRRTLPTLTLSTNKDYIDLVTFISRQWEEIGIPVTIDLVETASLREQMREGTLSAFRGSWIADYPDEETFLTVFYGKNPAPPNYTRFRNETYDLCYEHAMLERDESNRKQLYHKMDSILIAEAPVIFLFYDQTAWFAQPWVSGLQVNALNLLRLNGLTGHLAR